jgi:diadenosine tetraphosphatase ApaH/serine/threonine PP2A family protein phosphatase
MRKYGSSHAWTYFTDMFDFLTLSVVIDDRVFCVHGGACLHLAVACYWLTPSPIGLSPSIHSIDQIKVLDRFREIPPDGPIADLVWSDPDPEKEDFAISPRLVNYSPLEKFSVALWNTEGPDTHLVPVSCTNFWKLTRCPISCARTSYAWKATPPYLTGIYQLFGPPRTIVGYSALFPLLV